MPPRGIIEALDAIEHIGSGLVSVSELDKSESNSSAMKNEELRSLESFWTDWIADITYIRLRTEFVYLAFLLDGYSRKA